MSAYFLTSAVEDFAMRITCLRMTLNLAVRYIQLILFRFHSETKVKNASFHFLHVSYSQ